MACRELGIDIRTRQRWLKDAAEGGVNTDGRKDAERKKPVGALSEEERERVLEIADSPEYASKAPAQIVATLADKGEWVASAGRNRRRTARGIGWGPVRPRSV